MEQVKFDLVERKCKHCTSRFRVLKKSKQWFCSILCRLEFSGDKKKMKEAFFKGDC